jgi:hypothetical protein
MNESLKSYIETEVLPTTGIVDDSQPAISTYNGMVKWVQDNLRIEVPQITPQLLSDYLLLDNEGIIVKRRNFYLNPADFYDLELPIMGGSEQENDYKEIISVLIMPDAYCKSNELYYCTCDEWMIITAV